MYFKVLYKYVYYLSINSTNIFHHFEPHLILNTMTISPAKLSLTLEILVIKYYFLINL